MKTRILTLTAALLLLGGFVACNDSEESEYIGTPPVTASADVSAFFKTYLPSSSSSHPEPEFNFSKMLGDIVISMERAQEQATLYGQPLLLDSIGWGIPDTLSRSRPSIPNPIR